MEERYKKGTLLNMKILNYNEFISLNESFQSSKLRNIIAQHGKPKYKMDNVLLYDLKDDEIAGVFDWNEWRDYHRKNPKSFCIYLKDDSYLGITNPDILSDWLDSKENEDDFKNEIMKRRDDRHKGNELNGLNKWEKIDAMRDKTNDSFRKKKTELIHSRNLENVMGIISGHEDELVDAYSDYMRVDSPEEIVEEIRDIIRKAKQVYHF